MAKNTTAKTPQKTIFPTNQMAPRKAYNSVIVVLQYNRSDLTIGCLRSIKELNHHDLYTIVVDNNSKEIHIDNTRNWVNSQSFGGAQDNSFGSSAELTASQAQDKSGRKFTLIESRENLGYAGGNNLGIKHAMAQGAEYILILNNDTVISADLLDKLISVAETDSTIGAVSPAIKESTSQIVYYGKVDWLKSELKHSATKPTGEYLNNKQYLIGAAILLKRSALEKVEGFSEAYFLYFEDADLSQRLQRAGFKLKIVPEVIIEHQVAASTSQLGSPLVMRYHMRNALLFNSLNAPWYIRGLIIGWAGWVALKQWAKLSLLTNPATLAKSEAILDGVGDFYNRRGGRINDKTQMAND